MRQLQSLQDSPIDINHLSTIFVLDNDHNGRVTLPVPPSALRQACAHPLTLHLVLDPMPASMHAHAHARTHAHTQL